MGLYQGESMPSSGALNPRMHVLYLKGGNYAHGGFSQFLREQGYEVTSFADEKALLDCYHESQVNAFNIFGGEKYHCLIFDVFSASQKSFSAVRHLRSTYSELPPIIALITPEQSFGPLNLQRQGFDHTIAFPLPGNEFIQQLRLLTGNDHRHGATRTNCKLADDKMEGFPVISLKTYLILSDHAGSCGFSLLPLYNSFLEELNANLKLFIDSYEKQNRSQYEPLIISIRGLCATMGASQIYQLANRMESFSRQGQTDQMGMLLPYLIEKYLILKDYISHWERRQRVFAA